MQRDERPDRVRPRRPEPRVCCVRCVPCPREKAARRREEIEGRRRLAHKVIVAVVVERVRRAVEVKGPERVELARQGARRSKDSEHREVFKVEAEDMCAESVVGYVTPVESRAVEKTRPVGRDVFGRLASLDVRECEGLRKVPCCLQVRAVRREVHERRRCTSQKNGHAGRRKERKATHHPDQLKKVKIQRRADTKMVHLLIIKLK